MTYTTMGQSIKIEISRNAACVVIVSVLSMATQNAFAQAERANEEAIEIEEIIVTARQRDETLQDVPVAVTAISAQTLENTSTTDIRDLANYSPGLLIDVGDSGAGGTINIRGIGTSPSQAGFEQAASIAIDGVQVGRPRIFRVGLLDVRQIEVLKGPQALFFGKNSPAGVVAIKTADPTDEFSGFVRAGYEFNASEYKVQGAFSGPLTERIGARLAVSWRDSDGFIKNLFSRRLTDAEYPFDEGGLGAADPGPSTPGHKDLGGSEEKAARLTLTYDSDDGNFNANLKTSFSSYKDTGPSTGAGRQLVDCSGAPTGLVWGVADPFGDCVLDDRAVNAFPQPGLVDNYPRAGEETFSDIDQTLVSLSMNWQLRDWTLTSVTGYYDQDSNTFDFYDAHTFAQVPVAEEELYTSFSQEVRLLSNLDGPLNYLIGAFYQDIDQTFNNNAKIQALGADPGSAVPKYHWWEKRGETEGDTISVFAQLMWDITDQWELSAGVRYTDENKDSSLGHDWFHLIAQQAAFGAPAGKRFEDEFNDQNWSPEATLAWRPTDGLTLYGSYRTGFKSGGMAHSSSLLGYVPGVTDDDLYTSRFTFDSEEIDGFEVGFKSQFMNGQVTFNAAAYSYQYDNLQVSSFSAETISVTISNAASATVDGVELDVTYQSPAGVLLYAAVAYNKAEYEDFVTTCYATQTLEQGCNVDLGGGNFGQSLAGQPLPIAPEWSGNLGFDYETDLSDSMTLGFTGNARYTDDYHANEQGDQRPAATKDSFWIVDAGARLVFNQRLRLALIGRNLTDEMWFTRVSEKPGASNQLQDAPKQGRQYVVELQYDF